MENMSDFGKVLFLWLMFSFSLSAYASEQSGATYIELQGSSYKLAEEMATHGASLLIVPEAYTKFGVWTEDRFMFPGSLEGSDVVVAYEKIDDKPIEIIQLQLRSNVTRTLEFSQIKATPTLVLQFKAPPSETNDKAVSSIYIRVYIGKMLLDRLRVSSDAEWVRKEYSLSNAQFLKQKLNLTLSMSCDAEESMLMLFGYFKR